MQFILRRAVDEAVLISELKRILGFVLEPIGGPAGTAEGVYSIARYRQGFAMYVAIYWNAKARPLIGHIDAALWLAKFSEDSVVTDLPEDRPEHAVPAAGAWPSPMGGCSRSAKTTHTTCLRVWCCSKEADAC